MPELFVELLSEEIPARMQRRAAEDLRRLVTDHLVDAGLTYEGAYASATPRRLVLSVHGLPARSPDRTEERRGPRVGAPEKAIAGFVRAAGLASIEDAVVVSDPKKGEHYLARTNVPGRAAQEVCGEAIASAVRRFPWPVSMRWGKASVEEDALRWVRPLTSIVATFGAENEDPDIVPVALPVPVGDVTVGHRVHAPDAFRVRRLSDYASALERAYVTVDIDRRRETILADARDAVFALGLELVEDDGLLEEVAGLVEWPVVHVGRFDEAALELPDEVIRLTIRENQKCFVTRDPQAGRLANTFVLVANIEASDGGAAVIAGNERVVRARLADARFFWEQDRRLTLAEHAQKLKAVTFHEKLGSQWERVERIATLAREIAPSVGADPDLAEQAARLAKADLGTLMVGEFPELQGYVGRRYAEAEGLAPEVAAAIEEHYAPQGPSDAVPTAPVSVAVALADKVDALASLWIAGGKPTGSSDAFGLRRAALGVLRLTAGNELRLNFVEEDAATPNGILPSALRPWRNTSVLADYRANESREGANRTRSDVPFENSSIEEPSLSAFVGRAVENAFDIPLEGEEDPGPVHELKHFVIDRYAAIQRDQGVPYDVVLAIAPHVRALDFVDVANRITALQTFLASPDGATLLAGYKRAVNILRAEAKKDGRQITGAPDLSKLTEAAELRLAEAIETARTQVAEAVAREDYTAAMTHIAALREPVDEFFDNVMVNADDPDVRMNRLRLLAALREVTRQVADFSAISG